MSKQCWYHGSLHGDIENFLSMTHFGSRLAAIHAIDHFKHYIPPARSSRDEMSPTIYSIEIDLNEVGGVIELEDWGSPNSIALTNWLIKKYETEKRNDLVLELQKIQKKNRESSITKKDFSIIGKWLLDQGIRVIQYLNEHEGHNGESSICIVDRSILDNDAIKAIPLTMPLRLEIENEPSDMIPFPQQHAMWGIDNPRLVRE